jgi:hypothetical protein
MRHDYPLRGLEREHVVGDVPCAARDQVRGDRALTDSRGRDETERPAGALDGAGMEELEALERRRQGDHLREQ